VKCWYCGSERVALVDGEWVCTDCGTVLGCEVRPPRWAERALWTLERESKVVLRAKYSLIVEHYIYAVCRRLGEPALTERAVALFRSLPKTAWQGKSPRAVAAAVVYLVASRLGYTRRAVADTAKVSPLTVRDVALKLKKYLT